MSRKCERKQESEVESMFEAYVCFSDGEKGDHHSMKDKLKHVFKG